MVSAPFDRPKTAHACKALRRARLRAPPRAGRRAEASGRAGQFEAAEGAAERLEAIRVAQGRNLHAIVVDEQVMEENRPCRRCCCCRARIPPPDGRNRPQAREAERQEMLGAVQPARRGTLARLFDHERAVAAERIMRLAAENEMVLLQEMALAASAAPDGAAGGDGGRTDAGAVGAG